MNKIRFLLVILTFSFVERGSIVFSQIANKPGSGNSLFFNGNSDCLKNIGNTSSFSFIQNTGIFTIEAWIKSTKSQ